jgi:hypothetical protein
MSWVESIELSGVLRADVKIKKKTRPWFSGRTEGGKLGHKGAPFGGTRLALFEKV